MNHGAFVILGIKLDGKPFRPSDWAERLCSTLSVFGPDRRMRYSPHVRPVTIDGVSGVAVDGRLKELEPHSFRFLVDFAWDNKLRVRARGKAVAAA
jgi:Protein of unknown function (DUF3579)